MFPDDLVLAARLFLGEAEDRSLRVALAESCTGGLLAALLTEIPGSSAVVERGFVVYSNKAKEEMLGVPGDLIADFGAVSEPVARSMAEGAVAESRAHVGVSITGVAGPGGGTALKPVGLVHFGCAREGRSVRHEAHRFGDLGRAAIRMEAVRVALRMLHEALER